MKQTSSLNQLLTDIRPATEAELQAQRESYAGNYKPGPRQARLVRSDEPQSDARAQRISQLERELDEARERLARAARFVENLDPTDYVAHSASSGTWSVGDLAADFVKAVQEGEGA